MTRCVQCKATTFRPSTHHSKMTVGEQTFEIDLPSTKCRECGEEYIGGDAVERAEHAVARHLAEHGPATPDTFRFMRKAIGLSGKELAELLDTTGETISRWEKRGIQLNLWAWLTLGSIVLDEIAGRSVTRDRLRAIRAKRLAKTVPIEIPVVTAK